VAGGLRSAGVPPAAQILARRGPKVAGGKREARRHRIRNVVIRTRTGGAVNQATVRPVAARFALATGYRPWCLRRPKPAACRTSATLVLLQSRLLWP
jgi:hypothetical protein